jgi:hypothetical protein
MHVAPVSRENLMGDAIAAFYGGVAVDLNHVITFKRGNYRHDVESGQVLSRSVYLGGI